MAGRRRLAIWSPEALGDMDEIWNYYEQVAGRNIAEKIIRGIGDVVATIADHPFAGRPRDELRRGFRSLATHPHIVFYWVVKNTPEIIRVLDGRQDIEEIFADGDKD